MTNILSQAEIDELLDALSLGVEPEQQALSSDADGRVMAYDFKTANKFPKEQMRTLNIIFQAFAQLFANRLTGILRTSCECEVLPVEELSFNEFNNSLPTPVILAILAMPPLEGSVLFEVSPEAAYMIIGRLLGGSAGSLDSPKQFTEIELALIERVLRQSMGLFDEAWSKVLSVNCQLERVETSPQFAQIVPLNEPAAVVTINLSVGGESGLLSMCIPHAAIEPIAKQLNARLWFSSAQDTGGKAGGSEQMNGHVLHAPVTLTAYFEDTPALVRDIVSLQVGDVIRINQKVSQPLKLKVQHIPKFYAKIGTSEQKYAVQIVDIIKGDDQDESVSGRN